jgi:hypothetical protein
MLLSLACRVKNIVVTATFCETSAEKIKKIVNIIAQSIDVKPQDTERKFFPLPFICLYFDSLAFYLGFDGTETLFYPY